MKRKIILSLAMSLDGYIATKDGEFDWIVGDGDQTLNTEYFWDYGKFLETVDAVVMGGRCYRQGLHKDLKTKNVYVATSEKLNDENNIRFINGDIVKTILEETKDSGKNIFIFGGGGLVHNFLKSNVIDEYYVGIVPVILGDGITLFRQINTTIKLHLTDIMSENGVVVLKYAKR